jgi:hypothetical protein
MKASNKKIPQPTPTSLSENQIRTAETNQKIATLQENYFIRDRYRCVIFRKFDINKANRRIRRDDNNAKNNDDYLL